MLVTQLQKENTIKLIKKKSADLGFFDCGISAVQPMNKDAAFMEEWLSKGYHGEMGYLERNREKRYHPDKLVEGAKSVLSVLFNYYPEEKLVEEGNYKISKYAYGKDYHHVIKEKLKLLLTFIEGLLGERKARIFVDSAPVLDRAWARNSGLGFIGKNTMLINKKGGSFFFIGHIIMDLELDEKTIEINQACGKCSKCIDACPTQALSPFEMDARKCISYLSIEFKGDLETQAAKQLDNWIVGCDICQDVCPWNRFARPHSEPKFVATEELKSLRMHDWEQMDKTQFNGLFKRSAVERTGFQSLKRNIMFNKSQ